jgi:hypothetical protein
MNSVNYTFEIVSPTHGTFVVTAPLRFRDEIEAHTWSIHLDPSRAEGREFEARTHVRRDDGTYATVCLHRLIWSISGRPPTPKIDHADGQPLNCSETNLRAASNADNARNSHLRRGNASGAIGVSWNRRDSKWEAHVRVNGKLRHVGRYWSLAEAQIARDAAALRHHGEFAVLNEPPSGISADEYAEAAFIRACLQEAST